MSDNHITLSALLDLLTPAEHLFVIHRLGPHECEAVAEGTAEELRETRCVELCGENAVERLTIEESGYPWDTTPVLIITIGERVVEK